MSLATADFDINRLTAAAARRREQAQREIMRTHQLRRLEERLEELLLAGRNEVPDDFVYPPLAQADLLKLLRYRQTVRGMIWLILEQLLPIPPDLPGDPVVEAGTQPDERKVLPAMEARQAQRLTPFTGKCYQCGQPIEWSRATSKGRPPIYCGKGCKVAAHRARKAAAA